jgi:hypothetical protein
MHVHVCISTDDETLANDLVTTSPARMHPLSVAAPASTSSTHTCCAPPLGLQGGKYTCMYGYEMRIDLYVELMTFIYIYIYIYVYMYMYIYVYTH